MDRIRLAADHSQNLAVRERPERNAAAAGRGSFREQLRAVQVGQWNDRIDAALARVDQLGARLAESCSTADLKRYRTAIAELMRDLTQQMVQVRSSMEWDAQAWEHRTLVTIRRVNEELEHLTELVLAQEKDHLAILERIGEIKGLLVDVRM